MVNAAWPQFLDGRLVIKLGDIAKEKTTAIVNAANNTLYGGGGVDGAIHSRGGPEILEACRQIRRERYPQGLPTGLAVATPGGNLTCRYVIHTVGPVWRNGKNKEHQLLASCYQECLTLAADLKLDSVAFPAISTGVYGFPRHEAGPIAWKTITDFLLSYKLPRVVYLVFYKEQDKAIFLKSVRYWTGGK